MPPAPRSAGGTARRTPAHSYVPASNARAAQPRDSTQTGHARNAPATPAPEQAKAGAGNGTLRSNYRPPPTEPGDRRVRPFQLSSPPSTTGHPAWRYPVTANDTAPRAGRREWIGLAALALATLAVSFDIFVLLLALPHLSTELGASSTEQLWIVDIYGFMVGGLLI